MWDFDLYARLDLADAWAIIGPVNWYGPTSNLKLLFDRLVCANGGNPREDPIEHKNPELAMKLEHAPEWEGLSLNHLEGRTAAFFCYSDAGANEMDSRGRPKKLRHKGWFDPEQEPFADMRQAYAPSGMAVPVQRGRGARRPLEPRLHGHGCRLQRQPSRRHDPGGPVHVRLRRVDGSVHALCSREGQSEKGKVEPGQYRACGYKVPGHRWADSRWTSQAGAACSGPTSSSRAPAA